MNSRNCVSIIHQSYFMEFICLICVLLFYSVNAKDNEDLRNGDSTSIITEARTPPGFNSLSTLFNRPLQTGASINRPYVPSYESVDSLKKRCPLCDSSVYSYCSEKLLHDACCCNNPYDTTLPYQCRFADCSFLHANSCREHRLITACCCNNLYLAKDV